MSGSAESCGARPPEQSGGPGRRVMITGAAGLLAAAVQHEFAPHAELHLFDRRTLDLTDRAAVEAAVSKVAPQVIINCAAFNDVDGAEDRAVAALEANTFAVLWLARASRAAGATLIQYSTDFVFDGTSTRPYTEEDTPAPRSVYASSKLLGDWLALEAPNAYVLRVESLFGKPSSPNGRRGSLGGIVDKIRAGEEVPVFVDRTVSPSYTVDVARATRELLARSAAPGLYHCVNSGSGTWEEVAAEAARILQLPLRSRALTLASSNLKAPRPRYCAMSNAKLARAGVDMPDWRDALARYVAEL
jgi:dTDP-4-dehydrorhamnose reductase